MLTVYIDLLLKGVLKHPLTHNRSINYNRRIYMVQPKAGGMGQRAGDFEVVNAEVVPSKFGGKLQIQMEFRDLAGKWKNQFEWYSLSNAEPSAFWDLAKQLMKLKVVSATVADEAEDVEALAKVICKNVVGYQFKLEEQKLGRKTSPAWFPVEVIKEPSKKKK